MTTFKLDRQHIYQWTIAIIIICSIYYDYTGILPISSTSARQLAFAKARYFNKDSDVLLKELNTKGIGSKTYIAFEKSMYFKLLFDNILDVSKVQQHVKKTSYYRKNKKDGYKFVICEQVDLDLPIVGSLYKSLLPLVKDYEVTIINDNETDFRIYDVESLDIDNDGKQEIIVHWLDYGGGSGGGFISAVFGEKNDSYALFDFYPSVDTGSIKVKPSDFEVEHIELEKTKIKIKINGVIVNYDAPLYHTDHFYKFINTEHSNKSLLVTATSLMDGDCHQCAQSWFLSSYQFIGKKFVADLDRDYQLIRKNIGLTLSDIHGYTYSSITGIISYTMLPSWLDLDTRESAQLKYLTNSKILMYFK